MNKYRNVVFILIFLGMVSLLIGITYSFFNYTRTGSPNTLQVGRIFFETTEGPEINLTNVFPIDSLNVNNDTDNVGSVTINIKGDTDYDKGIEYYVTVEDVNNIAGTGFELRRIPINTIVTYENNGSNTIGTENENYFNDGVRGGNTSYYKILSKGILRDNDPLLVGYIAPGETGIDGNITIKTYFDKDRIAISDTFLAASLYAPNPNATQEDLNDCASFMNEIGLSAMLVEGEDFLSFCAGTGTLGGVTFQDALDNNFTQAVFDYLLEHGVIKPNYTNDTSEEWLGDRMLLSTSTWNNLNQNNVSFKIKVEANEGIWVEEPGKLASCPNCKFMVVPNREILYMKNNTVNQTPTVITDELTDNYLDLVNKEGKMYFVGLVLDEDNEITNAYSCGMRYDTPFCVEGTSDNTKYAEKIAFLQSEELWNNGCVEQVHGQGTNAPETLYVCRLSNLGSVAFEVHDHGCANVFYMTESRKEAGCGVEDFGRVTCGIIP